MPRKSAKKTTKKSKKSSLWSRAYNSRFSLSDVAKELWKLKGLVNSEMYKFDLSNNALSPSNTGTVTHLTSIAQGDGDGARTGNSVFVRSANIKGYIQRNAAGSGVQIVKLSLVIDKQQVGDSAPTWADIYEGTDVNCHLNSDTVGRFSILWTRTYILDNLSTPLAKFDLNKVMRHHVRYNGVNGTDIQKGGLYLVAVSSQATSNFPALNFDSRISYHDN